MAKTFLDIQNLRASKINEVSAGKILDTDLARFYNEIVSDMARYGQILKKVTTNLVASQADYTETVLPGLIATAVVRVDGTEAPYIGIQDYVYETDRSTKRHTLVDNGICLLPAPLSSKANALEVWYWAKLAEIIDAAVSGTSLTDLDDKDWGLVASGIVSKCYEKLVIYYTTNREGMPDASIEALIKFQENLQKRYQDELDKYGNQATFFNRPSGRQGPAARENEMTAGSGRQDK